MTSVQESLLARTFVELTDTTGPGFDLAAFLRNLALRCAEVLGAEAAGVLVTDGDVRAAEGTTETVRDLERLELEHEQGPGVDSRVSGDAVRCDDLAHTDGNWPDFAAAAIEAGFTAVLAIPMRQRDEVIGAVTLLSAHAIAADESGIGHALAGVAASGLVHQRVQRRQETLVDQLQMALTSRIAIEQAKGVLAERLGVDVGEAFSVLRSYARSRNRRIVEVARGVVEGGPEGDAVVAAHRPPR